MDGKPYPTHANGGFFTACKVIEKNDTAYYVDGRTKVNLSHEDVRWIWVKGKASSPFQQKRG
ncbi:hypothetical protein [Halobacillus mangrovi]|uniref:hypothetical protein n=1 Tax=Halobacillus mangrovi TaxID=402384 RepID=UPI003D96E5BF